MATRTGARLGTVTRISEAGAVYVELADVAPGFEFGPCLDTVGGLTLGDRIIAQPLARDEDELVITGILGGSDGAYAPAVHQHSADDITDGVLAIERLPDEAGPLAAYPVGAFYISAVSTSPATLFGGTWTQLADRMLIAVGSNPRWDTALETGGSETVTLTASQSGLPAHTHGITQTPHTHSNSDANPGGLLSAAGAAYGVQYGADQTGAANANITIDNNAAQDASAAHDNMPPFVAAYMWRRTA